MELLATSCFFGLPFRVGLLFGHTGSLFASLRCLLCLIRCLTSGCFFSGFEVLLLLCQNLRFASLLCLLLCLFELSLLFRQSLLLQRSTCVFELLAFFLLPSAGLALITGKPESNFIPGILINAVCLAVLLVTLAVRRPLIGVVVGLVMPAEDGEPEWRDDPRKRRVLTVATWLWVGLFALRLVIEIPLYLASAVELLAGIKLITGVPLYAAMLWVTWLLVRSVMTRDEPAEV